MSVDPEMFKAVMGQWPSGVTVVTTTDADGLAGMTASSFSSVSLDPPLVSVCVARHLATHDRLEQAGVFAVNILAKDQVEEGLRFAGMLPDVADRFDGIDITKAETGSPLLAGTLGWVDCKVWAAHDGGDHTIFVGEVLAAGIDETAAPLLYHSRSWGQFADVLASHVTLLDVGAEGSGAIVENAFGASCDEPADVDVIVERVRDVHSPDLDRLILDDRAAAADPMQVRLVLQSIGGLVGRTAVGLRLGAGPMAMANALVALKSGVHLLSAAPSEGGPYVSRTDLLTLLDRMRVEVVPTPEA